MIVDGPKESSCGGERVNEAEVAGKVSQLMDLAYELNTLSQFKIMGVVHVATF